MQGADMRTVMEVLGHSRMATTSDLYTHVLDEVKVDAAHRMDAFIRGLDGERRTEGGGSRPAGAGRSLGRRGASQGKALNRLGEKATLPPSSVRAE
jgi:hypothetical protein